MQLSLVQMLLLKRNHFSNYLCLNDFLNVVNLGSVYPFVPGFVCGILFFFRTKQWFFLLCLLNKWPVLHKPLILFSTFFVRAGYFYSLACFVKIRLGSQLKSSVKCYQCYFSNTHGRRPCNQVHWTKFVFIVMKVTYCPPWNGGIWVWACLSVCLSVCPSVRLSVPLDIG